MKKNNRENNIKTERVITPEPSQVGIFKAIIEQLKQIWISRYLIKHLFIRDFNAQFRQRVLGYLWIIIEPLIAVFGFVLMDHAGVLSPGTFDIPYPLYVLLGTTLWVTITNSMVAVANGLQKQSELILRTNAPKIALALSGLSQVLFKSLVQFITILLAFISFDVAPALGAVLYLPALVPLILFGTGIGLILSIFAVIAKDITKIFSTLFSMLMYATPVIYLSESIESATLQKIIYWNPLTWLIEMPRSLFSSDIFINWQNWSISFCFSLAIFVIGMYVFYLLEDKVAERL